LSISNIIKKGITPTLPTMDGYISKEVVPQYEDERYCCIATNSKRVTYFSTPPLCIKFLLKDVRIRNK